MAPNHKDSHSQLVFDRFGCQISTHPATRDYLTVCATVLRYRYLRKCKYTDGYGLSAEKLRGCKSAISPDFGRDLGVFSTIMLLFAPRNEHAGTVTWPNECRPPYSPTRAIVLGHLGFVGVLLVGSIQLNVTDAGGNGTILL